MPEGPEAKFMTYQLNKLFSKSKLSNIIFTSGRYTRHPKPKNYNKFIFNLPSTISNIQSKGKFIYFTLNNNWFIFVSLGMSGHFILNNIKHSNIKFITNKGNFFINDIRNFATINFSNSFSDLQKKLKSLGPDPLSEKISCKKLFIKLKSIKNQNTFISNLLLDQKFISGIGNYIRAESLFLSKLSPFRKIKNINYIEFCNLIKNIKLIMKKSFNTQIKNGIHTYKFYVYKRKFTDNGTPIKKNKNNGRTIWWVPKLQS